MEKLNRKQIVDALTKSNPSILDFLAAADYNEMIEKSETSHREYYYDDNAEQLQDSYHYISSHTCNHFGNQITIDTHWLIDIKDLDGREDISDCKSWRITHYTMDIA